MLARTLTAIIGIPITLGLLYMGGAWWTALLVLLTILASHEMGAILRRSTESRSPSTLLIGLGGVLFVVTAYESNWTSPALWTPVIIAVFCVAFVRELLRPDRQPTKGVGVTLLGAVYPGLLFAHLVMLRALPDGFFLTLLVILATWASDSAAFFVGSSLGRRKLLPSVSPNKTWEGAWGGVVGGTVMGLAMASSTGMSLWLAALIGALVSLAGQLGDLSASSMKREAGIKDTGALLPGHGGVIDRFDSLLFAGTVVYYTLVIIRGWPMG